MKMLQLGYARVLYIQTGVFLAGETQLIRAPRVDAVNSMSHPLHAVPNVVQHTHVKNSTPGNTHAPMEIGY
jgi:hypothetical protein